MIKRFFYNNNEYSLTYNNGENFITIKNYTTNKVFYLTVINNNNYVW